jgi:type II pantothenate kinase
MKVIGIDSGSTNVKLIEVDEKFNIVNKMFLEKRPIRTALDEFVKSNNIDLSNVSNIVLTGVGSSEIKEDTIYGIKVLKQDEFRSIATGGKYLAKKDKAIIVSIGTGTAFVRAEGNDIKHIGGTRCWWRYTF